MRRHRPRAGLVLGLAIALLLPASGSAAPPHDADALEGFFDGVVGAQMTRDRIAGAVVAVVRGGRIVLSKGYGFADLDAGRRVDPETTLFRPGSISKLFTWTAVMQLVEQGKLDLDTDVNAYLDGVRIPATFPEPITLTHLMTHTPGFEDRVVGLFAKDPARLRSLAPLLAAELPSRVRPPGRIASYSNHGTALAGLVVEQVSGEPFASYVERHILEPLGMRHSTFEQPLPPELARLASEGYALERGRLVAQPFELVPASPAGAMSATATDLARFALAHLGDGRLGGARILAPATARRMRERLHGHDPRVNGMAHGFIELSRNGTRVVGHLGDTIWFHSTLLLIPEHDLGVVASYNSATNPAAAVQLTTAFLDTYFPPEGAPRPAAPDTARRLDDMVGLYRSTRVPHTTYAKLGQLLFTLPVSASDDGALHTVDPLLGERRWIEIEPFVLREDGGGDRLVFQTDEEGRVIRLLIDSLPIFAFEKLGVWESPGLQAGLGLGALGLLGSTLVVWPIARVRGRRDHAGASGRTARLVATLAALLFLASAGCVIAVLSDTDQIVFGESLLIDVGRGLALLAALLTPLLVLFAWQRWRDTAAPRAARLYYVAITAASLVLVAWLAKWNLLLPG